MTGDSTKEETKEKWPPKSVVEKATSTSYRLTPLAINVDLATTKQDTSGEAEVPPTAKAPTAPQPRLGQEFNTFLENWRKDLPETTEIEPEASIPKPADKQAIPTVASVPKVDSPQAPYTPAKISVKAPVPTTSKTSKTPAKTPAKSVPRGAPPKQSLTPSVSQPLKPQHTGQSVASTTTSTRKVISKMPATPKTPARTDAGVKTPTSTRSKTPSLFAPTAASLARSRNTPLPPPPVKKTTLSSGAMERLVKPTAASLSKAKSTAPSSFTLKSPPRTSITKAKPPSTPSKVSPKVKKDPAVPEVADETTIATTVHVAAAVIDTLDASEEVKAPAESIVNGRNDVPTVEEPERVIEQSVEEPEQSHENTPDPSQSEEHEESIHTTAAKVDLEDIVNFLETAPVIKPTEEIREIPDEEAK
jgi:hypothetical protein